MPYISPAERMGIDAYGDEPQTAGQLNYKLTREVLRYLASRPKNYQAFNDALGALEGAKLELYRRHIAPYEDLKILENGDVLP